MPVRSKDAIIADLKKELEGVRLEDRSTKSELSKAKIDLEKKGHYSERPPDHVQRSGPNSCGMQREEEETWESLNDEYGCQGNKSLSGSLLCSCE